MFFISDKFLIYIIFCAVCAIAKVTLEKRTYMSFERPHLTYFNPKYVSYANWTSRRHNRQDPVHYMNLYFKSLVELNNNYTYDIYFLQLLTNQYKRSFVEVHSAACVLFNAHPMIAAIASKVFNGKACPLPPGEHNVQNMMVSSCDSPFLKKILDNFPFTKGKMQLDITYSPTKELVAKGDVDFEIKQIKKNTTDECY